MDSLNKIAIVTGANSGLGYETTRALSKKGFRVVMACRNLIKAEKAKNSLLYENPTAQLDIEYLDTSKFNTIRDFAKSYQSKYSTCNLLINNAGALIRKFELTEDGVETQFATNYFGHFLLTGLILKNLENTKESRIVSLGSIAHKFANLKLENVNKREKYSPFGTYSSTKLACIIFSYELQRRLAKANSHVKSVCAHPGISVTNFSDSLPTFLQKAQDKLGKKLFSNQKQGAESILFAALDESVYSGHYIGPSRHFEIKGEPKRVYSNRISNDKEFAKKLWDYSEKVTKFNFEI